MLNDLLWIAALLFFAAIGLWGYLRERKEWNGGVCKENGQQWKYFDTDSQGGRGYKAGDYCCWISWPRIDK
jgi:hypothetical protein